MSKGLDALNNIYGWMDGDACKKCEKDFDTIENELKALEIIKERKIAGLTLEWDGKWWTVRVHDYKFPIAYGSKKEEYVLLKEVLK